MYSLVAVVLTFVFWIGSTALIIKLDARRQRNAARARGDVDFMDRSITPYLILAVFSGALPLIFYFGTTRRRAAGWLLGIGVFAADVVAVSIVGAVLFAAGGALDKWSLHRGNLQKYGEAHATCGTPQTATTRAEDPCSKSLTGVHFYTAYGNDADQQLELKAHEEACDSGRVWACDYLADYGYGYSYNGGGDRSALAAKWAAKRQQLCAKSPTNPDCFAPKLP